MTGEFRLKRKKSADGQGSVYPEHSSVGKITRWRWEVMVGFLPDGRKDVRRGSAKREADAVKAMRKVASQKDTGRLASKVAASATIGDLVREYLAESKAIKSGRTHAREEQLANLHIAPTLGALKQDALTPATVRRFVVGLTERGLAQTTAKNVKGVLARAVDRAVEEGALPFNAVRTVRLRLSAPAKRDGDEGADDGTKAFGPTEVADLLSSLDGNRFGALWRTAVYTGARIGEVTALTWRDFDAEAGTLTFRRSLLRESRETAVTSRGKTRASRRTLQLPAVLVATLRAHRAAQNAERLQAGAAWHDNDLVFATKQGKPLKYDNLRRNFGTSIKGAHLQAGSPHWCRHSAASNMLAAGVPVTEVAAILGHATPTVTTSLYAHAIPRGGARSWTPPSGLAGLEVLALWYDRGRSETHRDGSAERNAAAVSA